MLISFDRLRGGPAIISDKAISLCLLKILWEYSDIDHKLQMKDLIAKFNTLYELDPDRRTVYRALELLKDMGFEVSSYETDQGYYLKERLFELSEIRLLMDAVYSFRFISPKHAQDLIDKLQQLLSVYDRKRYRHLTTAQTGIRTSNREVFYNIDRLEEAIVRKVKVQFNYLKYSVNKTLVQRRDKKYTVNPYEMVLTNEHYYLVCAMSHQSRISLYRIDRMKDVQLTEEPLDPQDESFNPGGFVNQSVYAFSGEPEHIKLICDISILDHLIDRFGTDIHLRTIRENKLEVQFLAPPYGVKFWALQFLPYVEISSPSWLRQEIIDAIQANPYSI